MATFDSAYRLSRKLGSGGFGSVYKCYLRSTNVPYAVKFFADCRVKRYTFSKEHGRDIPDEIALWSTLRHTNVIRYVTHFLERGTWIVVMEHCSGYKDLFSYVNAREQPLSESSAVNILSQTLSAIQYCRSRKVDHRDIKDENILYNPATKHVKLIDFGSASLISTSYCKLQGTDVYHPPEWFLNNSYNSTDATVWALGSLAFILLNGDCPYPTVTDIVDDTPLRWTNNKISSAAQRFIRKTLRRRPVDREPLKLLASSAWLKQSRL